MMAEHFFFEFWSVALTDVELWVMDKGAQPVREHIA